MKKKRLALCAGSLAIAASLIGVSADRAFAAEKPVATASPVVAGPPAGAEHTPPPAPPTPAPAPAPPQPLSHRTTTAAVTASAPVPVAVSLSVPPSGIAKNVLTNSGVALLARAGYSEGFIIDMIHHKQTQFDVSAEGLVWLAGQGLSERIVRAMVANEKKEEQTAIVPASIQVVTQQTNGPAVGQSAPVQVSVPVSLPTGPAAPTSWYVRGYDQDRWYVIPNVPMLATASMASVSAR